MPTRALGALLAAIAAAAFVVSIVSGAWWDGHPRVDGRVFTAKDVHIGLLGGTGCNTGGTGECQPLPLGSTFTTVAYGELGGLALTTAFAILIAGAAWRGWDSRKRLAKLGMVLASLAAAGAVGLLVLGPQIKTTQNVVQPLGWGFFLFGGGNVAMLSARLAPSRPPPRRRRPRGASRIPFRPRRSQRLRSRRRRSRSRASPRRRSPRRARRALRRRRSRRPASARRPLHTARRSPPPRASRRRRASRRSACRRRPRSCAAAPRATRASTPRCARPTS